jgi:hypothetical protein
MPDQIGPHVEAQQQLGQDRKGEKQSGGGPEEDYPSDSESSSESDWESGDEEQGNTPKQAGTQRKNRDPDRDEIHRTNIRIATLNVGSGGLRKCLTSVRSWLMAEKMGILHLQEVYNLDAKKGC